MLLLYQRNGIINITSFTMPILQHTGSKYDFDAELNSNTSLSKCFRLILIELTYVTFKLIVSLFLFINLESSDVKFTISLFHSPKFVLQDFFYHWNHSNHNPFPREIYFTFLK